MDRGGRWWLLVGVSVAAAASIVVGAAVLDSDDDGSPADPSPTTDSAAPTAAPTQVSPAVEQWEDAVAAFDGGTPSSGCTLLETGDGSVLVRVNLNGRIDETITPSGPVSLGADDYSVSVLLGDGLTGDDSCTTDVEEVPAPSPRRIVTNWPAAAAGATVEITRDDASCAVAVVRLDDVVATSSSGRQIELGDVGITNGAWFSWAPFECRWPGD